VNESPTWYRVPLGQNFVDFKHYTPSSSDEMNLVLDPLELDCHVLFITPFTHQFAPQGGALGELSFMLSIRREISK
jgi:hypothetical protein